MRHFAVYNGIRKGRGLFILAYSLKGETVPFFGIQEIPGLFWEGVSRMDRKRAFLLKLGANISYLGFEYMAYALMRLEEDSKLQMKVLYMETAKQYGTTAACVERDIRTVSKGLWENRKNNGLAAFEIMTAGRRPRNTELLKILAYISKSTKMIPAHDENW